MDLQLRSLKERTLLVSVVGALAKEGLDAASTTYTIFRRTIARMAAASSELIGTTGRRYQFEELLQERPHRRTCLVGEVWNIKPVRVLSIAN